MEFKNTKLLFEKIDGNFPNHEPDPTTKQNMRFVKKELEQKSYKVGLGLDGDCDRMNPMTKSGYLVPGDQMLAIYSKEVVKDFKNAPVVFDIKSSEALDQALESYGAIPCVSPSGHSIIQGTRISARRGTLQRIAGPALSERFSKRTCRNAFQSGHFVILEMGCKDKMASIVTGVPHPVRKKYGKTR